MKSKSFSIHHLLENNKVIFVISLIVAIGIWITVSPQRTITVSCPVTINTGDSSAGKLGLEVVEGKEQDVSVTVQGKWYSISELTSKDINIAYSLSGIVNSGDYDLELSATKASSTADFTITGISPESVKVSLDHITTVDYKIEVATNTINTADGLIAGTPMIDTEKETISITGPSTDIKRLKRVVAELNVTETLSESKVYTAELKFLNKNDKEVDTTAFTIPYKEVEVTVPINQTKTVPIAPTFSNVPTAYAKNDIKYTLSTDKIQLLGTAEALEKIDEIELEAIDFKDITTSNNKFELSLQLPSGVTSSNGITEVTVTIDTSGYSEKTFRVSRFRAVNSGEGITSVVQNSYISMLVVGPDSVISELTAADLYIEYDMSNISGSTGSMTLEGTVKSSKYKNVWGTGDCSIQVKVNE